MYEEERERRPMVTNGAQMPPEQLAAAMHKSSVCPMVAPMHADTRPLRNNAEFLQTNVPILGKAKNQCTSRTQTKAEVWTVH